MIFIPSKYNIDTLKKIFKNHSNFFNKKAGTPLDAPADTLFVS